MMSRWCPHCETSWPVGDVRCAQCNELTRISHSPPIQTKEEAKAAIERRKFRAKRQQTTDEFDRIYAKREERRIAEGFDAPEYLGKQEARQIISLEKAASGS